jgi:hypothetical protein
VHRLTPGTGGSYLGDILPGLLVFGPGLGARYVPGSIASLAGVAEAKVGLASGLNNAQTGGAERLTALTTGFPSAFTTAVAPAD